MTTITMPDYIARKGPKPKPLAERLFEKTDYTGDCSIFHGAIFPNGYGYLSTRHNGPRILAHRLAWELANGPIPPGMCVCHRCDNPPCVRVDHLFLGTHAENMRDKVSKGRANTPNRAGERNSQAKLTLAQVSEIRALYARGAGSWAGLAMQFSVSKRAIGRILRNEGWSNA